MTELRLEKAICGAHKEAKITASDHQNRMVAEYIKEHLFLQKMRDRKVRKKIFWFGD